MPDRYEYLAQLIASYLRQELTAQERMALDDWLDERPDNRKFIEELEDTQHLRQKLQVFHEADRERLWTLIQSKLPNGGIAHTERPLRRLGRWLPYAAALFIGAITVTWYFLREQPSQGPQVVNLQAADVPPGGNRAMLTLADGRTITLDEARDGIVIGSGEITYKDGNPLAEVAGKGAKQAEVPLLALSTPKGGTYQITLPDGTQVWLNAASTLKYPSRFDGKERVVQLEGEAYFDVSSQVDQGIKMPFKVISFGQVVEVLGTQFNVSAYPDENETKTTLVGGSVRVTSITDGSTSVIIKPGQQSIRHGETIDVQTVDVQQYIGWKDGLFCFHQTPFDDMIRQVARWYDIEVSYQGEIPQETFTGKMQRELTLATMLNLLDISDAKIRLEDHRLVIQ